MAKKIPANAVPIAGRFVTPRQVAKARLEAAEYLLRHPEDEKVIIAACQRFYDSEPASTEVPF